jgi:hypothetical protein
MENTMTNIGKQMNKGNGNRNGNRTFDVLTVANITFTSPDKWRDLRCVLSI